VSSAGISACSPRPGTGTRVGTAAHLGRLEEITPDAGADLGAGRPSSTGSRSRLTCRWTSRPRWPSPAVSTRSRACPRGGRGRTGRGPGRTSPGRPGGPHLGPAPGRQAAEPARL